MDEQAERVSCELGGDAEAVGAAREHVGDFLAAAVPPVSARLVSDALLATSELVSNAVMHAPGPRSIEVELDDGFLRIAVSDGSTVEPQLREPRFDGSGGFGLNMLYTLAGGVDTRLNDRGKTVSIRLARALV